MHPSCVAIREPAARAAIAALAFATLAFAALAFGCAFLIIVFCAYLLRVNLGDDAAHHNSSDSKDKRIEERCQSQDSDENSSSLEPPWRCWLYSRLRYVDAIYHASRKGSPPKRAHSMEPISSLSSDLIIV